MYKTVVIDNMFGVFTLPTEQRYKKNLEYMETHGSVVWRTDANELHAMPPSKRRDAMARHHSTVFLLKMPQESCEGPEQYDVYMDGLSSWLARHFFVKEKER